MRLTFFFVPISDPFEVGHVRPHDVLHELPKANFFLWCEFLKDRARLRSSLEVSLVTGQLNPWVPLLVFVGLEERRPLNNVAQFPPTNY